MRRRSHGMLAAFLFAFLLPSAARAQDAAPPVAPERKAQPFLWVVDGPPRIYLFGTIHLPDPRVMDHPPAVKDAHAAADVVWGELPPGATKSPKAQAAVMLPEGQTLSTVLPKETHDRLDAYLKGRGMSAAMFQRLKPIYVGVTLTVLDHLHLMMKPSMDERFLTEGKDAGKEVGGLETLEEQLAVFDSCPYQAQARFLDEIIKQLETEKAEGKSSMEELVKAYVRGDLSVVEAEMKKMESVDDPEAKALAKRLLTDRNVIMVDRMLERAKAAPKKTYFVAVGAAHYPGPDGILSLLEKKGYKARRLDAHAKIEKPAPATTEPAKEPAGVK